MGSATQKVGGPLLGVLPDGATVGGSWTFTGPVTVSGTLTVASTGDAAVMADSATTNNSELSLRRGGSHRWRLLVNGTESGSNAGGTLNIFACTDTGATIDAPVTIVRAAGGAFTLGGATKRTLATTGGRVKATLVVVDTTTLDATHHVVVCNKATAMTINLPAVASNAGREYIIKNKGAGVVTVDGNASEQIDNAATQALNQWQSLHIVCDGAIWVIVN